MISRAVGYDTLGRLFVTEKGNRVGRPAEFEGPHFVLVFTLEQQFSTSTRIDRLATDQRRLVDMSRQPLGRLTDTVDAGCIRGKGHEVWLERFE